MKPILRISLDGVWDFLHLVEDYRQRPVSWREITVPMPWQAQFRDLRMKGGTGLYRRRVDISPEWMTDRVYIKFGAVFHISQVWINGMAVGRHIGGFLPFSFDATDYIREGSNEIKVRVDSPIDDPNAGTDANFAEIPFGKQSWYGPLSGIWQSVYLERRAADHVASLRIEADLPTGNVRTTVRFSHEVSHSGSVAVTLIDPKGATVARSLAELRVGILEVTLALSAEQVAHWSPDHPALYIVKVDVIQRDDIVDCYSDTFGFRTIEARNGRLYLNGAPFYLRGALDQDYYPDTICTTPSVEFLEDQFRKAKELGLNCLRLHIKAPDPRYYEVADRIGILVWSELPNMGFSTQNSRLRKRETLKGIIDRDGNHPSIICWTIINENWGVDLVHDPDHRAWVKETYLWLKKYDPNRLVVDNSPLAPSFHLKTDIADYHYYAAFPDSRADWDSFVERLAARPDWLFSTTGDAEPSGDEPLMCSEFGNWGLPDPQALRTADNAEPWWFETGHDWGDGVMYAHGVENRFDDWSLARAFGSFQSFVEEAQWQQYRSLKYEIEAMRAQPSLAGYVITEFTDAHWECNGLLDMRRNCRVFHSEMETINADIVIVPRWTRLSYWAEENATFQVYLANGSGLELRDLTLSVTTDVSVNISIPVLSPAAVLSVAEITVQIPPSIDNRQESISFNLASASGSIVATNRLQLSVHAPRISPDLCAVWSPDPTIRFHLTSLGYEVPEDPANAILWVATCQTAQFREHVRTGGRLLLLPQDDSDMEPLFPHWQNVRIKSRAGTLWRGDWASTFAWLRRGRSFADIPGGPLIGETFDRVIPTHVITGCNLLDFQARVHAGLVIGWIHKPVAIVVERGYGKGRFVVSTFRLFRDAPLADPTATLLLDRLLLLAVAEGSARSREQETVIDELLRN